MLIRSNLLEFLNLRKYYFVIDFSITIYLAHNLAQLSLVASPIFRPDKRYNRVNIKDSRLLLGTFVLVVGV